MILLPSIMSRVQEKFRHHRDLWRLDLVSCSWEQLPAKGGPNARSGHRMAVHKDSLVLFGGFHDNGKAASCVPCLTTPACYVDISDGGVVSLRSLASQECSPTG